MAETQAVPLLSVAQQQKLDAKKVEMRLANEQYLRRKPEVQAITKQFLHKLLEEKPDDVLLFAHKFFTEADLGAIAADA